LHAASTRNTNHDSGRKGHILSGLLLSENLFGESFILTKEPAVQNRAQISIYASNSKESRQRHPYARDTLAGFVLHRFVFFEEAH
jgi:hypothetical protein